MPFSGHDTLSTTGSTTRPSHTSTKASFKETLNCLVLSVYVWSFTLIKIHTSPSLAFLKGLPQNLTVKQFWITSVSSITLVRLTYINEELWQCQGTI